MLFRNQLSTLDEENIAPSASLEGEIQSRIINEDLPNDEVKIVCLNPSGNVISGGRKKIVFFGQN